MSELPWVISVDDHVVEPPHLWETWLPERFREGGPHLVEDTVGAVPVPGGRGVQYVKGGDGPVTNFWVYEDLIRPIPQVMACAGFPPEAMTVHPIRYDEMRPGCWDRSARIADMDLNRTERSMCFPSFGRFAGQTFSEAKDKELALACVRAYNDWMIEEWCGDSGGRLIPLCIVPMWDAQLCADEVRRNAARGCTAIAFTELPSMLGLPSIHSGDWNPMFEACAETGTVINMHIGSGSVMPRTSADAPAGVTTSLTSLNAYMSMSDWLCSGALARFPALKIAFSESQVGWMPFLLERLDTLFVKSKAWNDFDPILTELPSSYVPGRVFGCFFDDMLGVDLRHLIGVEQLVFETDYPHQDSTWPHTDRLVAQIAERVTPHELELLVRTNAINMLSLDPRDLRPASATAVPA